MSKKATTSESIPTFYAKVAHVPDAVQLDHVRGLAGNDPDARIRVVAIADDKPDSDPRFTIERVTTHAVRAGARERVALNLMAQPFAQVDEIVVDVELADGEHLNGRTRWWAGGTPNSPVLRLTGGSGRQLAEEIGFGMCRVYVDAGLLIAEEDGDDATRICAFVDSHVVGRVNGAATQLGALAAELADDTPDGAEIRISFNHGRRPRVDVALPGRPSRRDAGAIAEVLEAAREYALAGDPDARRNQARDAQGKPVLFSAPEAASWGIVEAVFAAGAAVGADDRITNMALDQVAHAARRDYDQSVPASHPDSTELNTWARWSAPGPDGTVRTRTSAEIVERIDRAREAMLRLAR